MSKKTVVQKEYPKKSILLIFYYFKFEHFTPQIKFVANHPLSPPLGTLSPPLGPPHPEFRVDSPPVVYGKITVK